LKSVAAPDFPTLRAELALAVRAARGEDPLLPVTVVCPSDLAREETRRDLARRTGGTMGVRVRAWAHWIAETAAPEAAREGACRLPEPGFERLVARILDERVRGGPLAAAAGTPGLARTVAATLADLIEGGFPSAVLAAEWGSGRDPVRGGLLRVLRALEGELAETGRFDRRRQEAMAARALAAAAESGRRRDPLLLFGFHDLTPLQRSAVLAAAATRSVTLLVPGPGGPGGAAAEPLLAWARDRGAPPSAADAAPSPLLTLAERGFGAAALADPGPERVQLATWPTEVDEVRGIARAIRREVAGGGRAFDEFLVTIPADGPSPRLFRRVFAAAGIPLADRAGVPAARTEDGRRAMALARAVSARRDDRHREALDFLPDPPRDPEREESDLFEDPFTRFTRARDWTEAVHRFRELFEDRFGAPAGPEVESALEALAAVHGARPNRPRDFARALGAALGSVRHRSPVSDAGGGARVLLVRMDQARGLARPVVFHAGLTEGAVRRIPREDPLLPDRLREALNERHEHAGLRLRRREEARVERVLLARFAFECAEERAVLSWARRRRTGAEERNPSGLLLDLAAARAGGSFAEAAPAEPPEKAREEPVDRIDADLAWLGGEDPPREEALTRLLAEERARDLPDALRATEGRWRSAVLTRWDGVLRDPRALRRVRARISGERRAWSPTALEAASNCPFSYLVERVLRLGPPEERESDFDPGTRGRLFHELLETVAVRLRRDGLLPLRGEHVPGAVRMLDDLVAGIRAGVAREPPGRRAERLATLAALRDDLAVAIALDAAWSAEHGSVPERFEYEFGLRDPGSAPRVDLGEGVRFRVRGRADRVDRRRDGTLEVVDVKTGRPRVAAGRIARTEAGRTSVALQLPLYLAAVEDALGERVSCASFWHATAEHGYRRIAFTADDLERARPALAGLIRHVAAQAEAGWFPSMPGDSCCRGALAPACGPAAGARFLRKTADPDLRERLRLLGDTDEGRRG
jgi:hypothetical protein